MVKQSNYCVCEQTYTSCKGQKHTAIREGTFLENNHCILNVLGLHFPKKNEGNLNFPKKKMSAFTNLLDTKTLQLTDGALERLKSPTTNLMTFSLRLLFLSLFHPPASSFLQKHQVLSL